MLALSWTYFLLSQRGDIEQRVAEEAAAVLDGGRATIADTERLTYSRMVVEEVTASLSPGVGILPTGAGRR